jgi:hypothetical protein
MVAPTRAPFLPARDIVAPARPGSPPGPVGGRAVRAFGCSSPSAGAAGSRARDRISRQIPVGGRRRRAPGSSGPPESQRRRPRGGATPGPGLAGRTRAAGDGRSVGARGAPPFLPGGHARATGSPLLRSRPARRRSVVASSLVGTATTRVADGPLGKLLAPLWLICSYPGFTQTDGFSYLCTHQ